MKILLGSCVSFVAIFSTHIISLFGGIEIFNVTIPQTDLFDYGD